MNRLLMALAGAIVLALILAVSFGEIPLALGQAFTDPSSGVAEVVWAVRAPRAMAALMEIGRAHV